MKNFVRICYETIEVRTTGHYDLMYMKTKQLGSKKFMGFKIWNRRLDGI